MPWISSRSCCDALPELLLLAAPRLPAQLEEVALAVDHPLDLGVGAARQKLGRELDVGRVVALGLEPREPRVHLVEALHHDGEVRLGDGLVEAHDDVARLDPVAVADPQLADHAAGRVLDLLHVRVDHHGAGRDDRACKLGGGRKPADAAGEKRDRSEAAEKMAADGTLRRAWFAAHDAAP